MPPPKHQTQLLSVFLTCPVICFSIVTLAGRAGVPRRTHYDRVPLPLSLIESLLAARNALSQVFATDDQIVGNLGQLVERL